MQVNWDEVQKSLFPVKSYEELCGRLQASFAYPFIRQVFNYSLSGLADHTRLLLGGDARGRYTEYAEKLTSLLARLHQAGVFDILELLSQVGRREQLELFSQEKQVPAHEIVVLLKYLLYWVVPAEKYLSGLVRNDPVASQAIKALGELGVRTNLELLQQGMCRSGRQALAEASGLPEEVILALVNRADFSRLPWASKATISNIIGAGYASLAQLANADPEQVYADFFRYGKAIGKNLKLGNEIENSYRIARIVPLLVQDQA